MARLKDFDTFATGVFLVVVALLALYLAWPLRSTSSVGLGPGYIPKMFAFLLLGLGAVIAAHGVIYAGDTPQPWHLRPLFLVLAAVLFFALAIERFGMAVALFGLVTISSAAHREVRPRDAVILALAAVVFSWLIFIKGLGLTMNLWPSWDAA